jgi:hypothetical protein
LFLIAGTQHGGRFGATDAAGPCVNHRNPHDPYPAVRALLVALSKWIVTGEPAPASRIPMLSDGAALHGNATLVSADALHFPALPGFVVASAPNAIVPEGDWVHPTPGESPYRPLVPAVDDDGNDRAGLLLPDIAVPLGTYTGFNLYRRPIRRDVRPRRQLPAVRARRSGQGAGRPAPVARSALRHTRQLRGVGVRCGGAAGA